MEKAESFAIRCYPSDRDNFKKHAADNHPNQQKAFKDLMSRLQGVNNTELEALKDELLTAQAHLATQDLELVELHALVNQLRDNSAEFKAANHTNENQCIITAIEEAKKRKPVNDPSFVFTPSTELKNNMQRCISYQIKKSKYSRQETGMPERFTTEALEYYITNEFTHIKK
jgi:hypothetical protein